MAHNPPAPLRLEIMDRLGMLALDENHFFGGKTMDNYGTFVPESIAESLRDMADLVRRDRSHPSVWAWNFCNEVNCGNEDAAIGMRNITDTFDGTRAVTMNHLVGPTALAALSIQVSASERKAEASSIRERTQFIAV